MAGKKSKKRRTGKQPLGGPVRPRADAGGVSSRVTQKKGPFQELLETQPPLTVQQLRTRRVDLIKQIQAARGRPLVIYATSINVPNARVPAMIHREDIVPFSEVLDSINAPVVDVLLETPGGLAEVTIELVNLLRPRFDEVGFIVPHMAMSAGTIFVMSGDEILMDHRSSLGAIDPQFIGPDGRAQPAQAILTGIDTIREDVKKNKGNLDPVYVPILRNIDPGKLQSATNASELSSQLVSEWLTKYKFRKWTTHQTHNPGTPVTHEQRSARAREIADKLCHHQTWLSHGRPIKIPDLEGMGLKITDYGKTPDLQKPIWALWVNLHHFMSSSNIYKVYESETVEFYKIAVQPVPQQPASAQPQQGKAHVDVACQKCGTTHKVQANFGAPQPIDPGAVAFPQDGMLKCRGCGTMLNLLGLKLQLEAQIKQPILL